MNNICKNCALFHIVHKLNKAMIHYVEYYCGVGKSPVTPTKPACSCYIESTKED